MMPDSALKLSCKSDEAQLLILRYIRGENRRQSLMKKRSQQLRQLEKELSAPDHMQIMEEIN